MCVASPNSRQLSGLLEGRPDVAWKANWSDTFPLSPATAGMLASMPLAPPLSEPSVTA